MRRALLTLAVVLAGLVPLAGPASADHPKPSTPSQGTAHATSTCFWFGPTFLADKSDLNYAFPDSGAHYWAASFTIPDGTNLSLRGRYAHARYQSLNSYNVATNSPVDAVNDIKTNPDRGSHNPYLPGARRTGETRRSYTIQVADQTVPATGQARAANTLYSSVAGQDSQLLLYRIYLPDNGRDITGGVGLPTPVLTLSDGTVVTGDALCDAVTSTPQTPTVVNLPRATYDALRNQPGKPATFPATETTVWRAFYNTQFGLQCVFTATCPATAVRSGGQYSNIDNNYVSAYVNRGLGKVLTLRGKLPRTPQTEAGQRTMDPRVDMRYWSLCTNESVVTTKVIDCVNDGQLRTDRKGYYTIVISRPEDRPYNARPKCRVAWLEWPENGDGAGHTDDAFLVLRNMLPSADFTHAVQSTSTPGDEKAVMGAYLPTNTYSSERAFERAGCHRNH